MFYTYSGQIISKRKLGLRGINILHSERALNWHRAIKSQYTNSLQKSACNHQCKRKRKWLPSISDLIFTVHMFSVGNYLKSHSLETSKYHALHQSTSISVKRVTAQKLHCIQILKICSQVCNLSWCLPAVKLAIQLNISHDLLALKRVLTQ